MGTRQGLALSIHGDGCIWFAKPGESLRRLRKHKEHPDAPESPYFISLRTPDVQTHGGEGTLTQDTVDEIGQQMWDEYVARGLTARFIAPIPNAALPYGEAMVRAATRDSVTLTIVQLIKEGEGATGGITGIMPGEWQDADDDEVIMVDDLITAAGTKKDALKVLRDAGLTVKYLLVVVDREQGGVAEMSKLDVETIALLAFSGVVDILHDLGAISEDQLAAYHQYLVDDREYDKANGLT